MLHAARRKVDMASCWRCWAIVTRGRAGTCVVAMLEDLEPSSLSPYAPALKCWFAAGTRLESWRLAVGELAAVAAPSSVDAAAPVASAIGLATP